MRRKYTIETETSTLIPYYSQISIFDDGWGNAIKVARIGRCPPTVVIRFDVCHDCLEGGLSCFRSYEILVEPDAATMELGLVSLRLQKEDVTGLIQAMLRSLTTERENRPLSDVAEFARAKMAEILELADLLLNKYEEALRKTVSELKDRDIDVKVVKRDGVQCIRVPKKQRRELRRLCHQRELPREIGLLLCE